VGGARRAGASEPRAGAPGAKDVGARGPVVDPAAGGVGWAPSRRAQGHVVARRRARRARSASSGEAASHAGASPRGAPYAHATGGTAVEARGAAQTPAASHTLSPLQSVADVHVARHVASGVQRNGAQSRRWPSANTSSWALSHRTAGGP